MDWLGRGIFITSCLIIGPEGARHSRCAVLRLHATKLLALTDRLKSARQEHSQRSEGGTA